MNKCSRCFAPPVPNKTKCQHHIDLSRKNWALRVQRQAEKGLCTRCDNATEPNSRLCKKHHDEMLARPKRGLGHCLVCPEPQVEGYRLCQTHLDNKRQRQYYNRKLMAYKRNEIGLCSHCRKPVVPGLLLCERHRDINRKNQQCIKQRRRERGVCLGCGKERDNTALRCVKCLMQAHKWMRKAVRKEMNNE